MKQVKLTSLNKIAFMLARGYFTEEDFTIEDNRLVLIGEVEEDYLTLLEEYKEFEEENREFLQAFKRLKLIRNALLEQEQEIEEQEGMINMKMDLRTPQQRLEERLKQIEDKLDRVLKMLEAKEAETVEKKSKKSDN